MTPAPKVETFTKKNQLTLFIENMKNKLGAK